ncbi:MAG: DNA modification methylase [Phycisphaerales bacterium]|nr:MAG: DNA modification methylase [Phycisphaerales bacterium]
MAKAKPKTGTHNIAPNLISLATPVGDVSTDPANLRIHDERSIEALRASLRRFGQQKPIVVDDAGVVVAGNGTFEAAKSLGWTHVATIKSDLVGVDRTAYAIADNRTAELSRWDDDALRLVLADMPADMAESAGWSQDELAELLTVDSDEPAVEHTAPDLLPIAVTQPGDLWELDSHRLLCGDSTEDDDVDKLMNGHRASLVATDPPYLVDYTGVRAGDRGKDWSATYREVEITDAAGFFRSVFGNIVRVLAPNAAIYCWHAHKRLVEIIDAWRSLDILDHQQIIWVKPAAVFGSVFWHFRHEPCLMGWVQGSKPTHNGLHDFDSVWTSAGDAIPLEQLTKSQLLGIIKDASSVWEVDWEGKSRPIGNEHPTQKPVEIFARPIRKHTKRGDVCYEPFSGSGSQLVAAEQLGRRCYAMELEPVFVDVGVRRWQMMTGRAARLAGDGRTWAEIARSRGVDVEEHAPCPPSPSTPAITPDATSSPTDDTAMSTDPSMSPRRRGGPRKGARPRGGTVPAGVD